MAAAASLLLQAAELLDLPTAGPSASPAAHGFSLAALVAHSRSQFDSFSSAASSVSESSDCSEAMHVVPSVSPPAAHKKRLHPAAAVKRTSSTSSSGSGSGPSSGRILKRSQQRDPNAHNNVEKKRRAYLTQCYQELKEQVPAVCGSKASNVTVLRAAAQHILDLQEEERRNAEEMARLLRIRDQQIMANAQLTMKAYRSNPQAFQADACPANSELVVPCMPADRSPSPSPGFDAMPPHQGLADHLLKLKGSRGRDDFPTDGLMMLANLIKSEEGSATAAC